MDTRCTYCREWKPGSDFSPGGDHVVPASMGGRNWVDSKVCRTCNERANAVADELVGKDFLVRFLRARYGIVDRYGTRPPPPVYSLRLAGGGVVTAQLDPDGLAFDAGLPPSVAESLSVDGATDQPRLRRIFADALGSELPEGHHESLELSRIAQKRATPPHAWSRFIAKLGLACGREAYGDAWLDTRQAQTLSSDLLTSGKPRFSQRTHHPPVEPSWPYQPPKHQLWIQPFRDTALLCVALFGQVLGAIPVNDLPADADPSAWSVDPQARTFYRSNYPAIWLGHAANRIMEAGGTPYMIGHPEHPFIYTPDGPDGPINLGVPMTHVESLDSACDVVKRLAAERDRR